jgi:hypothetical protein
MRSFAPPILPRQSRYAINPPPNANILAADPLSALGSTRLYPSGGREIRSAVGPPSLETATAAQDRILGTAKGKPRTASDVAAQESFDKTMGFTPAAVTGQRVKKDPYDLDFAENSTGTFKHYGTQSGPLTGATPGQPIVDPGSIEGRNLQSDNGYGSIAKRWAGAASPTGSNILGRASASGVSNSQAAGFQQPTAANPIGVTETSPERDVNKLGKKLFTGF